MWLLFIRIQHFYVHRFVIIRMSTCMCTCMCTVCSRQCAMWFFVHTNAALTCALLLRFPNVLDVISERAWGFVGRVHCVTCGRCQPPEHDCATRPLSAGRCHVCGSTEHKRAWHDEDPSVVAARPPKATRRTEQLDTCASTSIAPTHRRSATATDRWTVSVVMIPPALPSP